MQRAGLRVFAGQSQGRQLGDLAGKVIRHNADHALGADRHEGEGEAVVAAQHRDGVAQSLHDLVHAVDAAAGLLDVGNVRILGAEALDDADTDLHAAAAGDGVEHEGFVRDVGEGGEMPEESLLGRAVVIGSDEQHAIGAGLGGDLGHHDGFVGGVGACAGDDGHAAARGLDGAADEVEVLFVGDGR